MIPSPAKFLYNFIMGAYKAIYPEIRRVWRWCLPIGVAIPIFSLMVGLLFQTVFYEIARGIPPVIRQDWHVSLPLCKIFPNLYGCDPWIGALTGSQILELSQQVGQFGGMCINLILVALASMWITVRVQNDSVGPGLLTGIAGVFSSLVLVLAFHVPLNFHSPQGIIHLLLLCFIPASGWVGGRFGMDRLARRPAPGSISFLPVDETAQSDWVGESLSKRELEVLAMVAEGFKNQEIAQRLYISQATVKTHLVHIYGKLGVRSRTAAVTKALACGLLRQEEKEGESQ